jgi:hypothetical protein
VVVASVSDGGFRPYDTLSRSLNLIIKEPHGNAQVSGFPGWVNSCRKQVPSFTAAFRVKTDVIGNHR